MGRMIGRLLDRRVPQYVGLYVAGGWGFVQFVDWAVDQYQLSVTLTNLVIMLLILLLPTVIVLSWRYGAPGDDQWKRRDAAAITLNAVLAGAVLFGLFRDMDLRATTTVKLLEDAEGNLVERTVPTAAARRDILLFDVENETGDADLDWLEHGLASAVSVDLLQDIFVNVESLFHRPVRERVAEARLGSGDDIPLALMQDIAQARGMDFFVDGTIQRAPAGGRGGDAPPLLARIRLYDTPSGRLVAAHEYPMTGPLDAADPISRDLRRDADIAEEHLEESPDLPVEELITNSPEAFRALAEARARLGRAGDPAGAMVLSERAVSLDSTSALAQNLLASAAALAGNRTTMLAASTAALKYNYRLPEPMRLGSEVRAHVVHGDMEAAVRTARYWTERYPQDLWGHEALARAYRLAGDDAGWIRALRGILAIDSTDVGTMEDLAFALVDGPGMTDSAVGHLERARDLHPEDVDIRLDLANLLGRVGRFDAAREALEGAAAVAPRDPDVSRFLALLDLRQGEVGQAFRRLDEVRARERTPTEIERRAGLEETLFYVTGQFRRLEDAYRRRLALLTASRTPSEVTTSIDGSEYLWYAAEAGRGAEALAQIDSLKGTVGAPWNLQLDFPAARIHLDELDVEGARAALVGLERLTEYEGGREAWLRARIAWIEGRIAELEDGDCARASSIYERTRDLQPAARFVRTTRLECLTTLGRWDEAEQEVDWLLTHWPGWTTSRLAVAQYFAARGRSEEASIHLDYVLRTWSDADPEYRPALEARALDERLRGGE